MKKFIPIILVACALAVSGQSFEILSSSDFAVGVQNSNKATTYPTKVGDTINIDLKYKFFESEMFFNYRFFTVKNNIPVNYGQNFYYRAYPVPKPTGAGGYSLGSVFYVLKEDLMKEIIKADSASYPAGMWEKKDTIPLYIQMSAYLYKNQIYSFRWGPVVGVPNVYLVAVNNKAPLALLDYTVDQELGEPLYYIDLNGRQLTEPKGLAVAVYSNGRRRKVLFE